MTAITQFEIPELKKVRKGKVREVYELGDCLLMVASDRISAFDVIMPNGIPDKGKILNQLSAYWFRKFETLVPHHMITSDDEEIEEILGENFFIHSLQGRCMIVEKCEPLPIECVPRAYIAGSLYKEYVASGGYEKDVTIHGINFPRDLKICDKLPETIFTPATKAQSGHDENINMNQVEATVGKELAERLKDLSIQIFEKARVMLEEVGIILADTKFEFGLHNGELMLIDEVLTPDSSRFWPKETYQAGVAQESLDKQYVRDYLESTNWDKSPPAPELPDYVVQETRKRYIEIFKKITRQDPVL